MLLHLYRYSTSLESTLGILSIDGIIGCYILEDTRRETKVSGETRIPAGIYDIKLRDEGSLTKKYRHRYGSMHQGMLHLQDVPNFRWVYIHTGVNRSHTAGCLLTGSSPNDNTVQDGRLSGSRDAYRKIYPGIASVLSELREQVRIRIVDAG